MTITTVLRSYHEGSFSKKRSYFFEVLDLTSIDIRTTLDSLLLLTTPTAGRIVNK